MPTHCPGCGKKLLHPTRDRGCRPCYFKRGTKPASYRYWKNVIKKNGCWDWVAAKDMRGYGITFEDGKRALIHRVSWKIHFGEIPNGMFVCHRCDNPSCSNPEHLYLGTQKINMLDAASRFRMRNGEAKNFAKLTNEKVIEIRKTHVPYKVTYKELAKKFGCHERTIRRIVKRKTWFHI